MVHMTCSCLNIRIHVQQPTSDRRSSPRHPSVDSDDSNDGSAPEADDPFLDSDHVIMLDLAVGGITKRHEYLCMERAVGAGWTVIRCAICSMDAFATNRSKPNQVLVNMSLERDEHRIRFLRDSSNYSQVFGVVLPQGRLLHALKASISQQQQPPQPAPPPSGAPITPQYNPAAEAVPGATDIKHQVSRYLIQEQAAMEDRIRKFTEKEHSNFAAIQLKVGREKEVLCNILKEIESSSTNTASKGGFPQTTTATMSTAIRSQPSKAVVVPSETKKTISNLNGVAPTSSDRYNLEVISVPNSALDVGGMFEMEGLDVGGVDEHLELVATDDEEADEKTGFNSSEDDDCQRLKTSMNQFATSLPINVPVWSTLQATSAKQESSEESTTIMKMMMDKSRVDCRDQRETLAEDPSHIAENIQALAWSVRDGKELFGDVPRRRLNTGDLVRSRLRYGRDGQRGEE